MNKIYLIKRQDLDKCTYDEFHGFVVIAKNEQEAKMIIDSTVEQKYKYEYKEYLKYKDEFICEEVDINKKGVVLVDYLEG